MLEFCVVDEIEVVLFSISLLASTSFFAGLLSMVSVLVLGLALRAELLLSFSAYRSLLVAAEAVAICSLEIDFLATEVL